MSAPDVSVIIGAYNAMPYLIQCVSSVVQQSLDAQRFEIIAVDDGSTDGTGEQLDRFAAFYPNIRVIHQPNSGGPSRPRNVALDQAQGRYVFFLDADDYLGSQTLERLAAMADRGDADIVLGKIVGVGGRKVATAMFTANVADADIFTTEVYRTLSVHKLFRRSHIERLGLRFAEDLKVGEDQLFTGPAMINAGKIGVLADYDYYYLRRRENGGHVSPIERTVPKTLELVDRALAMVASYVEPGPRRDHLTRRHFRELGSHGLNKDFLRLPPADQAAALQQARGILDRWYTMGAAALARPGFRIVFHLAQHGTADQVIAAVQENLQMPEGAVSPGRETVENGRIYAGFSTFRDPASGVPDECFDITEHAAARSHLTEVSWQDTRLRLRGQAHIERVSGPLDAQVVVRHRSGHFQTRIPARVAELGEKGAEFDCVVDMSQLLDYLSPGAWDLFLDLTAHGVTKQVRLGKSRAATVPTAERARVIPTPGTAEIVTSYFTKGGYLALDVGEQYFPFRPELIVDSVVFTAASLLIAGRVDRGTDGAYPDFELSVLLTEQKWAQMRVAVQVPETNGSTGFIAEIPLERKGGLGAGAWSAELELVVARRKWRRPVTKPTALALPDALAGRISVESRPEDSALVIVNSGKRH